IVAVILDGLIGLVAEIPGFILMGIAGGMAQSSAVSSRGHMSDDAAAGFVGMVFLGYGVAILGGLGVAIYNIYLLGKRGSTLGKGWMKIKVVDQYGQPLGFWKAFARELIKGLLASVSCGILLLWPLWDKDKQGLWDKVFDTNAYEA